MQKAWDERSPRVSLWEGRRSGETPWAKWRNRKAGMVGASWVTQSVWEMRGRWGRRGRREVRRPAGEICGFCVESVGKPSEWKDE